MRERMFSKRTVFYIIGSQIQGTDLAIKYGVGKNTIYAIKRGKIYREWYLEYSGTHPEKKLPPPKHVPIDRLRTIFNCMRDRCNNPKNYYYHLYGGRGISICKEWDSFSAFKLWALANGYADNLTLDRIDPNGNYAPINCRWATIQEQQYNKRTNRLLTIEGETLTVAQWVKRTTIPESTVRSRIRLGWDHYSAVFNPLNNTQPKRS